MLLKCSEIQFMWRKLSSSGFCLKERSYIGRIGEVEEEECLNEDWPLYRYPGPNGLFVLF